MCHLILGIFASDFKVQKKYFTFCSRNERRRQQEEQKEMLSDQKARSRTLVRKKTIKKKEESKGEISPDKISKQTT